ncbi:MAG: Rrf2 family transcriptional regulator [Myxococcales bacterium]|nr:Rrf2 family transcriptional regulator [Myxococcales bacterium]
MFKLSKTTDYGIVLLAQLASDAPDVLAPDPRTAPSTQGRTQSRTALADRTPPASAPPARNARDLAESADLPVPMVSKILKALAREGILVSQRGSKGGYQLARPPEDLTVADMIRVLEGPVALTDCAIGPSLCEHESLCAVREPWQVISRVVERALADVTLADLVRRGAGMRTSSLASAVLQIDRTPEAGARS